MSPRDDASGLVRAGIDRWPWFTARRGPLALLLIVAGGHLAGGSSSLLWTTGQWMATLGIIVALVGWLRRKRSRVQVHGVWTLSRVNSQAWLWLAAIAAPVLVLPPLGMGSAATTALLILPVLTIGYVCTDVAGVARYTWLAAMTAVASIVPLIVVTGWLQAIQLTVLGSIVAAIGLGVLTLGRGLSTRGA